MTRTFSLRRHVPRARNVLPYLLSLGLCAAPIAAHANDESNCEYFAQFIMLMGRTHDAGKTKEEAMQLARDKAKADHLDRTTTDLFVGEAIEFYYPKPKYHGSQTQIHSDAYAACIDNKLP